MRFGVRLGVDPGDARIGVASSDPSGFLATPVETVRSGKGDVRRLAQLVTELEAVEVVVGLPRSLNGSEGPAAEKARALAGRLARRVAPVPVRLCDERLTTVSAESMKKFRFANSEPGWTYRVCNFAAGLVTVHCGGVTTPTAITPAEASGTTNV